MLDWTRITELREELGADAFAEVIALFLEEVGDALDGMTGDMDGNTGHDPAALEAQLHFLKGACLNLGMSDVVTLCSRGEAAARQGRGAQVDMAAIRAAYDAARNALLARLREAGYLAA